MRLGFSAARDVSGVPLSRWMMWLEFLPDADAYITGGARNGDALIGEHMLKTHPHAEHFVIVPWNRSQVDPWWLRYQFNPYLHVIPMPQNSSYKDRNAEIVHRCDELVAFPRYPEHDPRSKRSGTWQTVRLARDAGKLIRVSILEESVNG